jgi:hypothetical protein
MSVSARLNRRGATLPLTIIALAVMGVAVAITHTRITAERRVSSDGKAQMGAFAVAQSGLNRFLANLNGKPAPPPGGNMDVTFTDLPGGTAQVSLRMLRDSTTTLLPAVYVITSRGTYTAGKRYNALTPPAERTVATYALWTPAPFDLNGAFTSLNGTGVRINGSSPRLSGVDRCGGAMPSIPGVASVNAQYDGQPVVLEGNPAGVPTNLGAGGTGGTADQAVEIDWAGIRAGSVLPADYTYPTWPNSTQMADWPVTKVNGDLAGLPSNGKGILIVTGNLVINGTIPPRTWEGVVLVGGTLTGNGASNIYGAVITGLNVKVGIPVTDLNDLGNGTKIYQYDSCALTRALGHVGSIQRVRNGWTDTWPSY